VFCGDGEPYGQYGAGASEGPDVAVLDATAPGGQAVSSSRIENYLGFADGISGAELTTRAAIQAQRFGARLASPCCVDSLAVAADGSFTVGLTDGTSVAARAVVAASGALVRRLPLPHLPCDTADPPAAPGRRHRRRPAGRHADPQPGWPRIGWPHEPRDLAGDAALRDFPAAGVLRRTPARPGWETGQLSGTEALSMFVIVLIIGLCLSVARLAGAVPWIVGLLVGGAIAGSAYFPAEATTPPGNSARP
jgi:hypothetical protein